MKQRFFKFLERTLQSVVRSVQEMSAPQLKSQINVYVTEHGLPEGSSAANHFFNLPTPQERGLYPVVKSSLAKQGRPHWSGFFEGNRAVVFPQQALEKPKVTRLGPVLPVLDSLVEYAKHKSAFPLDFSEVIFVCGQHLLSTTVSLFESLISLGAKPENIFVVGKSYSNNENAIAQLKSLGINVQPTSQQLALGQFSIYYDFDVGSMWSDCFKLMEDKKSRKEIISGIIVLDDGGHVSCGMPPKITGFENYTSYGGLKPINIVCIEQTSSGIESTTNIFAPRIEVATSATKGWIEPPLVTQKCIEEIMNSLERIKKTYSDVALPEQPTFGIVGLGKIGNSLLTQLIEGGYTSFAVFDRDRAVMEEVINRIKEKHPLITIIPFSDYLNVVHAADVVIGCTGVPAMLFNSSDLLNAIKTPKLFISCSSKDTETKNFLSHIHEVTKREASKKSGTKFFCQPLDDIYYKNGFKAPIVLARGGTPINFTNGPDSVAPRGIEPIRGLKVIACIQALHMLSNSHQELQTYKLDPGLQSFVMQKWIDSNPPISYRPDLKELAHNLDKISKYSGGVYYPMPGLVEENQVNRGMSPRR